MQKQNRLFIRIPWLLEAAAEGRFAIILLCVVLAALLIIAQGQALPISHIPSILRYLSLQDSFG